MSKKDFKLGDRVKGKAASSNKIRIGTLIVLDSIAGTTIFKEPCAVIRMKDGSEHYVEKESLEHVMVTAQTLPLEKGKIEVVESPFLEQQLLPLFTQKEIDILQEMIKSSEVIKQQYSDIVKRIEGLEDKFKVIEKFLTRGSSVFE